MSSIVTINGKTHILDGNNISINNNNITVDGKLIVLPDEKNINIKIEGNVGPVDVEHCTQLMINGDVIGNLACASGDIKCGDITGDCSSISGNIKTRQINGNAKTVSGNINHRFL
jgi:hypothetical protein